MKNHFLSLTVWALSPFLALAQQGYEPGYIVNPTGDTLRGMVKVNEKKPLEHYSKVMFKDDKGMQRTYKPAKIAAFGYGDKRYVSLMEEGEPGFFLVLARGPISLYELKYEGMRMNKITTESEYFYMLPEDKSPQPIKERYFRKQLLKLMEDNPEIAKNYPDEKDFDEEEAIAAINEYNAWKAEQNKE